MTKDSAENSLGYKIGGCVSKLLMMAIGLGIAFAMLEGVLRLAPERFFSAAGERSVWFHPTQSHKYGRNASFTWEQYGLDPVTVTTNAEGWRDVDYAVTKPADTLRIAVLGDSFSAAVMLPEAQIYPTRLEDSLAQRLDTNVEVLNAGIEGYNLRAEILAYRNEVRQYQPDLVIWQVYLNNDVADYPIADTFERQNSLKNRLLKSYGIFLIRCFYDQICGASTAAGPASPAEQTARDNAIIDYMALNPPYSPWSATPLFAAQDAPLLAESAANYPYESTAQMIDGFVAELAAEGIPVLLVFAPTVLQTDETLRDYYQDGDPADRNPTLPEDEVLHYLNAPPPYLVPTSALQTACATDHCGYITYDTHWNATGHAIVAQEIETMLCETSAFALDCQ